MHDYSQSGWDIQRAMLDCARKHPQTVGKGLFILWGKLKVQTVDKLLVPQQGVVHAEFLSSKTGVKQGFDISIKGGIELADGRRIETLRTWHDPKFESFVEYPYQSRDGILAVWNVYAMKYPGGQEHEEKWTGNAGFWVEERTPLDKVYHCSSGPSNPPDFDSMVFRVTVKSVAS